MDMSSSWTSQSAMGATTAQYRPLVDRPTVGLRPASAGRLKATADKAEGAVARRLRLCGDSINELGFVMLIAYQLEDFMPYSLWGVDLFSGAGAMDDDDAAFEFVGADMAELDDSAALIDFSKTGSAVGDSDFGAAEADSFDLALFDAAAPSSGQESAQGDSAHEDGAHEYGAHGGWLI